MTSVDEHPEGEPAGVQCGTHDVRVAAVVCCHMLAAENEVVGFIENSSDPQDLQAWCDRCQQFYLREGALADEFRAFNDLHVVGDFCYASFKARHTRD